MKDKIVEIANSLGIEIIGFTSVLDYSYLSDILYKRANSCYNSEFEEQDINRRLDARNVFPECKSIIAIGVPYALGYTKTVSKDKGLLSVSSYGEDYHKKLNDLLENLGKEIKRHYKLQYKKCVDTSSLLDREVCRNAGIGSYGKNSLLINEYYGSFIHLGYLLTDLELECDKNINKDICGSCEICIKSCPNGAILKEGGINSRRCISYLTQTREYIPLEYREKMKNQIYGCDVCQVVCPKNKNNSGKPSNIDYSKLFIDLGELLSMSNAEFKKKYGYLSGSWRGKNIWKRNALIAIGNLCMTNMFDIVKNELSSDSNMIKIYAAWCLINLNKEKATEILHNRMKFENDKVKSEYMKLVED